MKKRPKIALVLSGGGALGFAHVGVIDVLQKHNIPIDLIVGTSMGAIVGGAVACGKTCKEIESIAENMRTNYLYDINLPIKGVFSGKGALKFLKKGIPDIDMKDTKIPFICNAVDLITCKEIVFKEGSIIDNIRASMSVPGIFNPVEKDEMLLVDGGIINNMATNIAKNEGAKVIIAVDVISKSILPKKIDNAIQTVAQSMLIIQKELQKNQKKSHHILIQPELGERKQTDYDGDICKEIIELGREATLSQIDKIKELTNKYKK